MIIRSFSCVFISGVMCAGKSHISAALKKELPNTASLNFADALKQEVADRHGITVAELNANKGQFRVELQELGAERRSSNPNHWINQWYTLYQKVPDDSLVICDDCRHFNEAEFALRLPSSLHIHVYTNSKTLHERRVFLYGHDDPNWHTAESEIEIEKLPFHVLVSGNMNPHEMLDVINREAEQWVATGKPVLYRR